MTSMWNSREAEAPMAATVEIQEAAYTVTPGVDRFASKVKEIADSKDIKNFKVYLNGREVGPENAPSTFTAGDVVKIVPYDKAA